MVVVGSGIAGLTTALYLREAGLHVTVVTKVNIDDGSTRWAQGGIAAVLDPGDSPAAHARDTMTAGAGICDPAAVRVLVQEGPERLRELIRLGADFDRRPDGSLMLGREGGHRSYRVAHAGGDATGAEVQRALRASVRRDPWIRVFEHAMVVDLLVEGAPSGAAAGPRDGSGGSGPGEGRVYGVTLHVLGEGTPDGVGAVLASRAVVLAAGGLGQVFSATTNPAVSTGDGVALALRAGAAVADLEFVQFHPTALVDGQDGTRPLITEALRGEGAHLVDGDGKRFLLGAHELAELAPRDVVAKASYRVMRAAGTDHVYLDARHLGGDFLDRRFPTVVAACRAAGIEPSDQLIPVAPAAHYACGGVCTSADGRTSLPGLYACGEVARTGVHGANRLASNSLLEGLVFARRIARDLTHPALRRGPLSPAEPDEGRPPQERLPSGLPSWELILSGGPLSYPCTDEGRPAQERGELQEAMSAGAGVLRSAESLAGTAERLRRLGERAPGVGTREWELTNLLTVATAVVGAAYARRETRGCHWREDWSEPDPEWLGHLRGALDPDGSFTLAWERT